MIIKTECKLEDVAETLNGFEERFIAQKFDGAVFEELLNGAQWREGYRAAAMVLVARDLGPAEDAKEQAYQHIMAMGLKELLEFFPDEEGEDQPAEGTPPLENPAAPVDEQ